MVLHVRLVFLVMCYPQYVKDQRDVRDIICRPKLPDFVYLLHVVLYVYVGEAL